MRADAALVLDSPGPLQVTPQLTADVGRIAFHTLNGFHLDEVESDQLDRLWVHGGFPPSFLGGSSFVPGSDQSNLLSYRMFGHFSESQQA